MRRLLPLIWLAAVLLGSLLLLAGCGEPTPTPFPTETEPAPGGGTGRPSTGGTATAIPLESYYNETGGFRLQLPADWQVEEQGETRLGRYYRLGPPPLGPGPASSALFIAENLGAEEAAQQLQCGPEACADEVELEGATLGGRSAQRALIGEGATALEWFFVEAGEQLIFFTLHDPQTLQTRQDLLQTLTFTTVAAGEEEVAASVTPQAVEATATPTAVVVEPVAEWQALEEEGRGLTFSVPAGWEETESGQWRPEAGSALAVGLQWQQTAPETEARELLPAAAEIVASAPLTVSWGSGISATLQLEEGAGEVWQRHAVVQVGLRGYDFYSSGPSQEALTALQPVLDGILERAEVTDRLIFVGDPVEGTVAWFRALLRDSASEEALVYLSEALRASIPEGETAQTLLGIDQRFTTFVVDWRSAGEAETELEATLTLADGSVVSRVLTLVYDEQIGWRIERVEAAPPEASATESPAAGATVEATATP